MRWMTTILLAVILLFLLSFRVDIGLHRFFDVDEFTHVSLAMQVLHGQKPYLDFMTFFTPAYAWFLDIPLRFARSSIEVFTIARAVSVGVFIALLAVLTVLFGMMRGWKYAILPSVMLTFLPLPYDKFTEIRPDTLSALLGFAGVLFLILGIHSSSSRLSLELRRVQDIPAWLSFFTRWEHRSAWYWFMSGISFSLSVFLLQKSVPFFLVGSVFVVAYLFHEYRIKFVRSKEFFWFTGGLGLPILLFFFWVVFVIRDIDLVRYSLTTLALEVNKMSQFYFMEPHLYFFPTAQFFGGEGITAGLLVNHAVWFVGIVMGTVRMFAPWLSPGTSKSRVYAESMLAVLFFLLVYLYMYYVPLKHPQYLIPIAVFITFYASDVFVLFLNVLEKHIRPIGVLVVLAMLGVGIVTVSRETEALKMTQTNSQQMSELEVLEKIILPDEAVVDLEGRLFNRKYAYPLCCLPFGAFEQFISRRPSALRTVLEEKKVPYVYQGETNRISVLSGEDQGYLSTYYEAVEGFNGGLFKRKNN
ncbi:MAG: hypothetical protein AAB508_03350 [Patescibacteria group bacterium]